jgi:mannose-6-phosphate isomerase-like protein (cupin superfamily)
MAYDPSDLRSTLPTSAAPDPATFSGSEHVKFHDLPPAEKTEGASTWYARGQNFVVGYSELDGTATFSRAGQPDEYVVLLADDALSATVRAPGEEVSASGRTMLVVPPGDSTVTVTGKGRVLRLLTTRSGDVAALAANAPSYDQRHENIAPWQPWPEPVGGYRVRSYDLTVPPLDNPRFRLYRCTTFMVNFIDPKEGPRDPSKLSPHKHDDFEQCSIVLAGEYVHHIRWPWTTDKANWRPDEHEEVVAPAVTVIPPPSLHTSEAVGSGTNHLIDVFSPPRFDFSAKEGWVFNAADYPAPEDR